MAAGREQFLQGGEQNSKTKEITRPDLLEKKDLEMLFCKEFLFHFITPEGGHNMTYWIFLAYFFLRSLYKLVANVPVERLVTVIDKIVSPN